MRRLGFLDDVGLRLASRHGTDRAADRDAKEGRGWHDPQKAQAEDLVKGNRDGSHGAGDVDGAAQLGEFVPVNDAVSPHVVVRQLTPRIPRSPTQQIGSVNTH